MIQPQRLSDAFLHGLLLERCPDMSAEGRAIVIGRYRGWVAWSESRGETICEVCEGEGMVGHEAAL